ncbi:MAG: phosphopentomutase [Clostridium sp.]|nr:phosphopentomutase [Clostridium sp.]
MKRVILIVLDSVGIGELPDAKAFNDEGSHTLDNTFKACNGLNLPNLKKLGLGNIEGVNSLGKEKCVKGSFGKAMEKSMGKDTITGHWEISGVITKTPLKTYPNGFPKEIIEEFKEKANVEGVLGNKVASGTEIIKELGEEHIKTKYPIIYTSADSVFQIAAHEEVIPLDRLYDMCKKAREFLVGDKMIGRVIARPFIGEEGNFTRTSNRHDYALDPFSKTMLDYIKENNMEVKSVGKIKDIFNSKGITEGILTKNNMDGVDKTLKFMKEDFSGLIFTNLVEFDMNFGHRNDAKGYGKALEDFDNRMEEIFNAMKKDDILIITADHGCDPTTSSTDHSREYIPILVYGENIKENIDIGIQSSFSNIGKSILDYLSIKNTLPGESFLKEVLKEE